MKRLNLSLVLSLLVATQIFAQKKYTTQYEVQYDLSYSPDTLHLDDKTDETVYLYTGPAYGVFMNYDKAHAEETDSIFNAKMRSGGTINIESKSSTFHKTFYKNLQTGKVNTVGDIAGKAFKFTEPNMPLNWKVKDSTQEIMGYAVQKATTSFAGRDYVAWFTLSVPIHDGPYLFSGLPGLIVELYDTRKDYDFKLKALQKLDKPKTWTLPDAKNATKVKFKKLKAKAAKNAPKDLNGIINQSLSNQNLDVESMDVKMTVSKDGRELSKGEVRRMFRKMHQSKNNPIELK